MQKQILAVLMTGLVVSGGAWAKSDQALLAEAQKNKVSIAQAQKMPDETGVTLTGKIVRQLHRRVMILNFETVVARLLLMLMMTCGNR